MQMHQIRYFVAVADERHFTRAARRCGVSQPSLTRALKKLEEELGGSLFKRERRKMYLSELGQKMLPHFKQIDAHASKAKREAADFSKLRRVTLSPPSARKEA